MQRSTVDGSWHGPTYGEVKQRSDSIAQWLLNHGFTANDPVMVLSGNSIEHALLMLGCYSAGVPIVSLSPQYSQGGDFARLRNCNDVVRPKLIFAQSEPEFSAAMASLEAHNPALRFASINGGPERISFAEMAQTPVTSAVADAISAIKPSAVAKYLFTSGSSGLPKAVIQTHGMLMGTIAADEA